MRLCSRVRPEPSGMRDSSPSSWSRSWLSAISRASALEGELARMPDGAGKTIEQRRKKADAERRLEEVLRQQSVARHQLKSANRAHLVGVGTRR